VDRHKKFQTGELGVVGGGYGMTKRQKGSFAGRRRTVKWGREDKRMVGKKT